MATSARNWKKPDSVELELPSGNTCLVKRPGMEKLLAAGVLPDSLTPMAMQAIKGAQAGPSKPDDHKKKGDPKDQQELEPELMQKFLEKEGALEDIFMAFDKVTAMVVVEPPVKLHFIQVMEDNGNEKKDAHGRPIWADIPESDRAEEDLYTDEIDSEDKQFIFQFVAGGSADLSAFRDAGDDVAAS